VVDALQPGAVVGFAGLGRMGAPMAARLAGAGYRVRGFDPVPEARAALDAVDGAQAVDRAAEIAAGAAAVVLMLPGTPIVRAVLDGEGGVLAALAPRTLLIDMSSSDPIATRELATQAAKRGVRVVDAPVSGGVAGASEGTLTIMAGGDAGDVEATRPLLDEMGTVAHVGAAGAGHALKALNNLMSGMSLLATSEAMLVARRFGLDLEVILDVVNRSSGRSFSTELKMPRYILPETYDSGFALALMLKDMRIAIELARETGAPAVLGEAAVEAWTRAAQMLGDGADHTEIARWVAARAEGGA
jgi:3-hydroxyisobutyrate dehydrogenase